MVALPRISLFWNILYGILTYTNITNMTCKLRSLRQQPEAAADRMK